MTLFRVNDNSIKFYTLRRSADLDLRLLDLKITLPVTAATGKLRAEFVVSVQPINAVL